MTESEARLGLVKFLLDDGEDGEFYGVVKMDAGKVWSVGRKGRKQWEICDVGQVVSFDTDYKKHR